MKRSRFSRFSSCPRIELLEARIAPATLYVDQTGDYIVTNDQGTAGFSNGDTVTWDPGAGSAHGGAVAGLIVGATAFDSMSSALLQSEDGDTVKVGPGTFSGVVFVTHSVTVLGNQAGVDATTRVATAETILTHDTSAVVVLAADNAAIDGFTITASATGGQAAVGVVTLQVASGYTIVNNKITGSSGGFTPTAGLELASDSVNPTVVARNTITGGSSISGFGSPAINISTAFSNGTIEENSLATQNATGIAMNAPAGGPEPIKILRNTFSGGSSSLAFPSTGISIGANSSPQQVIAIEENIFNGQNRGVLIDAIPDTTKVTIHSNHFALSTATGAVLPPKAISSSATQTIDARYNWYGTADPAEVAALISGNVDFEPFLLIGDDARAAVAGFQSVPSLRLLKPGVATLLDADGDTITIKVTKGTLTGENFLAVLAGPGDGVKLQTLFLEDSAFQGANVSVTAKRSAAGGDNAVNLGELQSSGVDLGAVLIGGDLGRVLGGDDTKSTQAIKSLTARSMGHFGTTTQQAGSSLVSILTGPLGSLTVRGNVENAVLLVGAEGELRAVKIGGSLLGGTLAAGTIGNVAIRGSITGGAETNRGGITASVKLGNVTLGGSLIGSDVAGIANTAFIDSAGDMGFVKIGGSVIGRNADSARISTDPTPQALGKIAGVTIAGSLIGGANGSSGIIEASDTLGPVKILGDVRGVAGNGTGDAEIRAEAGAAGIFIGGSMFGVGNSSARILITGAAGPIAIKGNLIGGTSQSGIIQVFDSAGPGTGTLKSLTIGGSVVGGVGLVTDSASIHVGGALGPVKIGGSFIGGSGAIPADVVTLAGAIRAGSIAKVAIVGSFIAPGSGIGAQYKESASIVAGTTLGPVTIGGDILGTAASRPQILARGLESGGGITSVKVSGDVFFARILAGFSAGAAGSGDRNPSNAHAQIGAVTVGGDWTASDLVAGVDPDDAFFGNADDGHSPNGTAGPHSKIASVLIKGLGSGTASITNDHFGIVAEEIGKATIHGVKFPLTPGRSTDDLTATDPLFLIGPTNDFRVREVNI